MLVAAVLYVVGLVLWVALVAVRYPARDWLLDPNSMSVLCPGLLLLGLVFAAYAVVFAGLPWLFLLAQLVVLPVVGYLHVSFHLWGAGRDRMPFREWLAICMGRRAA